MSWAGSREVWNGDWRTLLIGLLVVGALTGVFLLPPIAQDPVYHAFADGRAFLGIPNFLNVATNAAFLAVGLAGMRLRTRGVDPSAGPAWRVCFIAAALIGLGSAYYHLAPDSGTLVWDRLPMSVAFMALWVAVLAEHIDPRLERALLAPAVVFGMGSVAYWHYFDDLRLYAWVQFMPLLVLPPVLMLFDSRYTHRGHLLAALALYLAAKLGEHYDEALFVLSAQTLSGHSLKHLLAAAALVAVYRMLRRRSPRPGPAQRS